MSDLADEDKGQLLDYMNILIQQQPLREYFALFLSDGFYFYVMAFDRKVNQYKEFTTTFKIGLRLFWVLLNDGSPFTKMSGPKSVNFSTPTSRICLKMYLGTGLSSTVYMIDKDGVPSAIKIFKQGFNPDNEVNILRYLNEKMIQNIPTYIAHDKKSMIITPVGEKISYQFRQHHALQLLNLLRCIHNEEVFHRDVRPSNILLDTSDNVILADWGSAIRKPSNELVPYEGTISFASPDILNNNLESHHSKASDDLHSFVRTLFILHNPRDLPILPDEDLSTKAQSVIGYWNDKLDGELWTEMVNGASNQDYDVLKKCCYVFNR
ncbi:5077_t:CDS:1 [Funneliformis geosporum]|uniref:647_t:CDS:1 n=1 Tax=Funneliformis geosporum TaxID=1117311 RepID=A0A9W4WVW8_9GLOM|nr:647_t:CDS:1 [Funneliformis geosporum]CAI2195351.1 5077_t:CDS:1 [Funneliformis geosporum]